MLLTGDHINAFFEFVGGICIWFNVKRLWRDKEVKGINWTVTLFMSSWGVFNLWYYPSLGQWWSFAGGLSIVTANFAWLGLLWYVNRAI